jgi:hypothetical protein
MQLVRNHLGELVLESLTGPVREGQVVRVGASGERALRHEVAGAEQERRSESD